MSKVNHPLKNLLLLGTVMTSLVGCNAFDRLGEIGEAPKLSEVQDPTRVASQQPVHMPMPQANFYQQQPNSLWQAGSRAFFRDQRAARVGDILTVIISIDEKAQLQNETKRSRADSEADTAPEVLGFETKLKKFLPNAVDPTNLVTTTSNVANDGKGSIDRYEKINLRVAATIVQLLPNGNLVLAGKQQVSVNFDMRELQVSGVIRPEDISADNTISYDKIAEARVSYGGKGNIQDVQQPRYGTQLLDVIMPF